MKLIGYDMPFFRTDDGGLSHVDCAHMRRELSCTPLSDAIAAETERRTVRRQRIPPKDVEYFSAQFDPPDCYPGSTKAQLDQLHTLRKHYVENDPARAQVGIGTPLDRAICAFLRSVEMFVGAFETDAFRKAATRRGDPMYKAGTITETEALLVLAEGLQPQPQPQPHNRMEEEQEEDDIPF